MLQISLGGLLRFLFITVPRVILGAALFLLAMVSKRVGAIGSVVLFQAVPYLPVRLMLSPSEARILRDDFMHVMDGVADALIEQHFGKGHTRELVGQELRKHLERGEFVNTKQYDVGEFGVSLLLTSAAIGLVHLEVPAGFAEALSLWIAVATLVLLFAVSIRTQLIEMLAYDEPAKGSLTENTKRFAWNSTILSDLYPLTTVLVLKSARFAGPDLYRLTAYSFGVSLEYAIREDTQMRDRFFEEFLPGCVSIALDEDLADEVPPAEAFAYLNR